MDYSKGLIFNIQRYSIHDGPGIRTTVFLSGCPLRCIWCANPEGQELRPRIFLNLEKCGGCGRCAQECPRDAIQLDSGKSRMNRQVCDSCGKCVDVCPNEARTLMGQWMSAEEVFEEIKKDAIFYESSGGGVTLSGGEPLSQPEFAMEILKRCRQAYIHTGLETCGHADWHTFAEVVKFVDLLLYDLKHMDPARHKEYTGVSNCLLLDNARRVARELSIPIWIRIPVIPGFNDSLENMKATAAFIVEELGKRVEQVSLLPYHRLGETKYERLELNYPLSTRPPGEDELQELEKVFEISGLPVHIGG